jgi:hypothetical protein
MVADDAAENIRIANLQKDGCGNKNCELRI